MMLDTRRLGEEIAAESARHRDDDPFAVLGPLDSKFFRSERVNIQIPILDPVVTRQCLIFLMDELPNLIAEMDRIKDRRSKSLVVQGKLSRWNQAFRRKIRAPRSKD